MDRRELDDAIYELHVLLQNDDLKEADFQSWLERNFIVFHTLGYAEVRPHVRMPTPDGKEFIPDFMAQTQQGLWEIVEIKTPICKIFSDKDRRNKFYESMNGYISQCVDYSWWLSQNPAKKSFEEQFSTKINMNPSSLLIAGRSEDFNRMGAYEDLSRKTPPVRIITYDDLMDLLNAWRDRVFGKSEKGKGGTLLLTAIIYFSGVRAVIADIGDDPDCNRITIGVSASQELYVRTIDAAGSTQESVVKPSENIFEFGEPMIIYVEVANTNLFVRISLEINGVAVWEVKYKQGDFILPSPIANTISANMFGEEIATMDLISHAIVPEPLSPQDFGAVFDFFVANVKQEKVHYLEFSGEKFMYTEGHPKLAPIGSVRTTNLIQPVDERKPILREASSLSV